ncbi:KilA-N domain-containing protein [Haemophilus influenzae]|uniref:KilA-N domain-containing protein n=1 Tax=Haemophilus influenzae TaxID=727 RepID=UPI0006933C75|nr:KilA-N domain-containing protein [Haemophilus influenzae]
MKNQIILANEVIALDEHGRISLNTLHKLSGTGKEKQPALWLRLNGTQELIAELDRSTDLKIAPITVIKGGLEQGTYAHELLAVSYAGWISPRFQLQVNQAFLDSHRQPMVSENINISKDEYIDLLKSKIHLLERKKKHHRRANKPLSMQEKSQIVLLHRQGLSNRQIAEQLNRSIATVWALVR